MGNITYKKWKDHDEWLALRKQGVGGSDAGAIMGASEYATQFTLWCDKRGVTAPFEGNMATRRGTFLEEFVAQEFCAAKDMKVRRNNRTIYNDKYPWALANVDREIIGENAILECKTTSSPVYIKKFRQGEFPEVWYWQVMHYMAVGEYDHAYIAAIDLTSTKDVEVWRVERDEEDIEILMKAEDEFWHNVQTGVKPEYSGNKRELDINKELWPDDNGKDKDLFGVEVYLRERDVHAAREKEAHKEVERLNAIVQAEMGEYSKGSTDNYSVSWKRQKTAGLDREAIKRDYPDIDFDKYATYSRVFRVTNKGGKKK